MWKCLIGILVAALLLVECAAAEPIYLHIHSDHWIYGMPSLADPNDEMVIRRGYALCNDKVRLQPRWVAYFEDPTLYLGAPRTRPGWSDDPWLGDDTVHDKTMVVGKLTGDFPEETYQRGHLAPFALFRNSPYWQENMVLSNALMMKKNLNTGAWAELEDRVTQASYELGLGSWDGNQPGTWKLYVMAGPIFADQMPALEARRGQQTLTYDSAGYWLPGWPAGEMPPFEIAEAYWKIIYCPKGKDGNPWCATFIMGQDEPKQEAGYELVQYLWTIDDIEAATGLDFFWDADSSAPQNLESRNFRDKVEQYLDVAFDWKAHVMK